MDTYSLLANQNALVEYENVSVPSFLVVVGFDLQLGVLY